MRSASSFESSPSRRSVTSPCSQSSVLPASRARLLAEDTVAIAESEHVRVLDPDAPVTDVCGLGSRPRLEQLLDEGLLRAELGEEQPGARRSAPEEVDLAVWNGRAEVDAVRSVVRDEDPGRQPARLGKRHGTTEVEIAAARDRRQLVDPHDLARL